VCTAGNGFPAGSVARAGSSSQLRSYLLTPPDTPGRPAVILTTIQKLGSLWRSAAAAGTAAAAAAETLDATDHGDLTLATAQADSAAAGTADLATVLGSSGRVAIIADEAHRHHDSHTSEQIADILAAVFGSSSAAASKQQQQQQLVIRKKSGLAASRAAVGGSSSNLQSLQSQQQQQQQQRRFVTYFGFTATPGPRALQLFGVARQVHVDVLGQVVTVQPTTAAAAATTAANDADVVQAGNVAGAAAVARQNGDDAEPPGSQTKQLQQQQASIPLEPHMAPATLYTPFHCYSLQQAVADGLVLDVLQRFVAVTPRFQIAGLQLSRQQQLQLQQLDAASRAVQGSGSAAGTGVQGGLAGGLKPGSARGNAGDDAGLQALMHVVGRKKARRAAAAEAAAAGRTAAEAAAAASAVDSSSSSTSSLAEGLLVQAASNSRQLVATKAEDVVGRFLAAWAEAAGCGFTGFRAMLVVRSRQHVVWYCQEVRRLLGQHAQQVQQLLELAGGGLQV
jgi:hypothetical protein